MDERKPLPRPRANPVLGVVADHGTQRSTRGQLQLLALGPDR